MKAAVLTQLHEPLVLQELELPETLTYGQVLVDIAFSGICGAQVGEIDGVKGPDNWLPHLLGHEGGGVVAAVGPGVKTVHPGDRVVLHWKQGSGIQSEPPSYRLDGTTVNAGWVTTFNERAVVSENRVTPIPGDFSLELAALLGCAITTAFGVVSNDAGVGLGESVVVLGVGGVGLGVVHGAAVAGAHPVIGVDLHSNKLELAGRLGATAIVTAGGENLEGDLRGLLDGGTADVVVETTGLPELIELAYSISAPQGRVILVGVPRAGNKARIYTLPLHFGKVLRGSHGGGTRPEVDIPRYIRLAQAGKVDLEALVTDRYAFGDINLAIEDLRSGKVTGRCIVEIAPELDR